MSPKLQPRHSVLESNLRTRDKDLFNRLATTLRWSSDRLNVPVFGSLDASSTLIAQTSVELELDLQPYGCAHRYCRPRHSRFEYTRGWNFIYNHVA